MRLNIISIRYFKKKTKKTCLQKNIYREIYFEDCAKDAQIFGGSHIHFVVFWIAKMLRYVKIIFV